MNRVFVSTWNVGGIAPSEDLDMADWLDTPNVCDIYVLGYISTCIFHNLTLWSARFYLRFQLIICRFQEIVPLRASNVLGSENNKISMKWNCLIREALNKKVQCCRGDDEDPPQINIDPLEKRKNLLPPIKDERAIEGTISNTPQDFHCIISKQMVGILISVWVRSDLRPYVRHPNVSCVGCGIMGCLGNKVYNIILTQKVKSN